MKKQDLQKLLVELSQDEAATINGGRRGRGADDPAGHQRRGRGADDPVGHG